MTVWSSGNIHLTGPGGVGFETLKTTKIVSTDYLRTSRAWVKSVSIGLVVSVLHRGLDP